MKKCTICNEIKNENDFYLNSRSNDGHQKHCKMCHRKMEKRWNKNNIDKKRQINRETMRRWRKNNPDRAKQVAKEWREKNKQKISKKRSKETIRKKRLIIDKYGGKCACCGISDIRFLSIDHKNNDGRKHRKEKHVNIHNYIIKNNFPEEFQILCFNCNFARAFHGGQDKICPHKLQDLID